MKKLPAIIFSPMSDDTILALALHGRMIRLLIKISLTQDIFDFFDRYSKALISWTYDHIIYSRRRMIYNIKNYCETYIDPESFKKRIDDFLKISDSTILLDSIVDDPDKWEDWFNVFVERDYNEGDIKEIELNISGFESLREATARYIETYENITGLNLIYALSGAVCGRYSIGNDTGFFESCIEDLETKYNSSKSAIIERITDFISKHESQISRDVTEDLLGCIVKHFPEYADSFYQKYMDSYSLAVIIAVANNQIKKSLRGIL